MKCRSIAVACILCAAPSVVFPAGGSADSQPVRLHVFDCGELVFSDISAFGLTNTDTDGAADVRALLPDPAPPR